MVYKVVIINKEAVSFFRSVYLRSVGGSNMACLCILAYMDMFTPA